MGAGGATFVLLPLLISGYLFNAVFYPVRYFSIRAEGQKLFFMAAVSGLVIGSIVFIGTATIAAQPGFSGSTLQQVAQGIDAAVPLPYACRLTGMLLLAPALAAVFNAILGLACIRLNGPTREVVFNWVNKDLVSPLALLLRDALSQQKLVLISLKSRKIYCGRILKLPSEVDSDKAFLNLLPAFSGYRDKDTLDMAASRTQYPIIALWEARKFKTSQEMLLAALRGGMPSGLSLEDEREYQAAMDRVAADIAEAKAVIEQHGDLRFDLRDWVKCIGIKEIESASFYDPSAYDAWFKAASQAPASMQEPAGDLRHT
jgi:hypothetical protein